MHRRARPLAPLPADYAERVYAGVLGKIVGVYLGRPVEQWDHARIVRELGVVDHYVHKRLGVPLIVADDDISGTFTFFRALADQGCELRRLTSRTVGHAWLNYLVPHQSIIWWGGIGLSTEHTAWHRLRSGIAAPASGSIARNGRTVAEQIGGQIFCDAWGLVAPGQPDLAADLAARAARVSHDGAAVDGARVIAALISAAFVESDLQRLLDIAVAQIESHSVIATVIADLRARHAANRTGDWHRDLRHVQRRWGYDRFPGGCHIVPNHALIILALLYSGGDFSRGLTLVTTAGWDTDCNAGNLGTVLAVRNGLAGLDRDGDWRGPVADRLYLPSADGGRAISDAVRETDAIVACARRLRGEQPGRSARFHFSFPGAVQGFQTAMGSNMVVRAEGGRLALSGPGTALTATFAPPARDTASGLSGYGFNACPTVYAGHLVTANVTATERARVRLVATHRSADGTGQTAHGRWTELSTGRPRDIRWRLPRCQGQPIEAVGIERAAVDGTDNTAPVWLQLLDWHGAPHTQLLPLAPGPAAAWGWVRACLGTRRHGRTLVVHHENGYGFYATGARDWTHYRVDVLLRPRLAGRWGFAWHWQGLIQWVAVIFDGRHAELVLARGNRRHPLARAACAWSWGETAALTVTVQGATATVKIGNRNVLRGKVPPESVGGAVALLVEAGSLECDALRLR